MPNTVKWSSLAASTTVLSTQLNSLSDGSYSAVGAEVDNATDRNMFGDLELDTTFASNPDSDGYLGVYIVTALDGTNYQDGGSSVAPPHTAWRGNFPLRAVTSAQKVHLSGIQLPPCKFKVVLQNASGQAMASSGSTVKLYTYNEEVQ